MNGEILALTFQTPDLRNRHYYLCHFRNRESRSLDKKYLSFNHLLIAIKLEFQLRKSGSRSTESLLINFHMIRSIIAHEKEVPRTSFIAFEHFEIAHKRNIKQKMF
jgi:hypothetical protein